MSFKALRASVPLKSIPVLPYAPVIVQVPTVVAQPVPVSQVYLAATSTSAPPTSAPQSFAIQSSSPAQPVFNASAVYSAPPSVAANLPSAQPFLISGTSVPQPPAVQAGQVLRGITVGGVQSNSRLEIESGFFLLLESGNSVLLEGSVAASVVRGAFVQSVLVTQAPSAAKVYPGITIGANAPAWSFGVWPVVATVPVPQNVNGSRVVVGISSGAQQVVVPPFTQGQSAPQPVTSAVVVPGITIGTAPSITGSAVQSLVTQAIAQAVFPSQVTTGIQPGVQIAAVSQALFTQAENVEQPAFPSRVIGAVTVGNPPSTQALNPTTISAQPVPQNVYGDQVIFGQPAGLVETVPLATLVKSVPYGQQPYPSQQVGGIRPSVPTMVPTIVQAARIEQPVPQSKSIPVFFISTVPKLPFIYGRSLEQPVTSVRVLGGITIGTPPPIFPTPLGLEGMTAPTETSGKSSPSQVVGLTDPSELSGV